MHSHTPYFLWDYILDDRQILKILHGDNEVEKLWLTVRILTHAKFDDIWKYLTTDDVIKALPKLRLAVKDKQAWQRALSVWGYHVQTA